MTNQNYRQHGSRNSERGQTGRDNWGNERGQQGSHGQYQDHDNQQSRGQQGRSAGQGWEQDSHNQAYQGQDDYRQGNQGQNSYGQNQRGGCDQGGWGNERDWQSGQNYGQNYGQNHGSDRDQYESGYAQGGQGGYWRGNYGGGAGYDRADRDYSWNRGGDARQSDYQGGSSWNNQGGAGNMQRGNEGGQSHRGRGPKNYQRSDDRICEDVCDRLSDDHDVDASGIDVSVSDREVTLSGEVESKQAKRHAEDCADSCSGVEHVQNNLRVKASRSGQDDDNSSKLKSK